MNQIKKLLFSLLALQSVISIGMDTANNIGTVPNQPLNYHADNNNNQKRNIYGEAFKKIAENSFNDQQFTALLQLSKMDGNKLADYVNEAGENFLYAAIKSCNYSRFTLLIDILHSKTENKNLEGKSVRDILTENIKLDLANQVLGICGDGVKWQEWLNYMSRIKESVQRQRYDELHDWP